MSEDVATATQESLQAPAAPPAAPPTPEPPAAAEAPAADSVEALPEWAQKLLAKTRSEAAGNRAKATEQAQALEATRDAIAKALGLKDDDDPVKAAQTAAEQRDAALAEAKAIKVENAVLRMAAKQGANAESLTDSRSFMRQLEAIDPAAEDFAAKVEEIVKAAVGANPALKAAAPATPPARSGGPVGGGAAVPGQLTDEDLKSMSSAEIVKAKEDGRLNELLGITK